MRRSRGGEGREAGAPRNGLEFQTKEQGLYTVGEAHMAEPGQGKEKKQMYVWKDLSLGRQGRHQGRELKGCCYGGWKILKNIRPVLLFMHNPRLRAVK